MAITTLNSTDSGAVSRTTINDNFTDLDTTKADLASPTFTGSPVAPTQSANDNSTKLATTAYVDAAISTISVESTLGVSHALTTVASQVVVVWASGNLNNGTSDQTVTLLYNGVAKHALTIGAGSGPSVGFTGIYTETPGAATANITVTTTGGDLENVRILVMKIG